MCPLFVPRNSINDRNNIFNIFKIKVIWACDTLWHPKAITPQILGKYKAQENQLGENTTKKYI